MMKLKGLGDVIALITKYTGIKFIVKKIFGDKCGCEERQQVINKLVPFKSNGNGSVPIMPEMSSTNQKENGE